MASNQLTTTTSSGQQGSTQSPQTAGQSGSTGTQSSSVQPGTATALLNSQNGVPLHGTALSTVSLNNSSNTLVPSPAKPAYKRHINSPLMGVSVLLFIIAVVLFWAVSRPVKSTTQY